MTGRLQRELIGLGVNLNTTQSNATQISTMLGAGTNTVTETFSLNPYAYNINPGTDTGSKLCLKVTETNSAEKKISVSIENAQYQDDLRELQFEVCLGITTWKNF